MKEDKLLASSCDCHNTDKKPLTRKEFREQGLKRDNYKCIFCGETEDLSVHHIIERRLFESCGGYHLNNAATVCTSCHIACEQTVISCEGVRDKLNITKPVLPEYMYVDHQYTKWGDVILSNGKIMPGPLFYDESVQKILKDGNKLDSYTEYYKYPRSYHLPFTGQATSDDKILHNASEIFKDKEIVITIKMDGSNFTGYPNYCHGRSIDSSPHEELRWAKGYHFQNIAHNLPEGFRYCAENMYAKHSIHYTDLDSLLLGFQIWDKDLCLSWDETKEWFELIGLHPVQEVYRGAYDESVIKTLFSKVVSEGHEGLVVRLASSFKYKDFRNSVGKLVRANHIADGSNHWRFRKIVKNTTKNSPVNPLIVQLIELGNEFGGNTLLGTTRQEIRTNLKEALEHSKRISNEIKE